MPLLMIIAKDGRGPHERRMAARAEHFACIETVMDRIAMAGPLHTQDGGFAGSVLVYDVPDKAAACALLAGDPHAAADVWESVELHPFTAAVGTWIPGKVW